MGKDTVRKLRIEKKTNRFETKRSVQIVIKKTRSNYILNIYSCYLKMSRHFVKIAVPVLIFIPDGEDNTWENIFRSK